MSESGKTLWTPGPWRVDIPDSGDADFGVYADEDCDIHEIATLKWGSGCRLDVEAEANARLIAAAPNMAAYIQKRAQAGDVDAQAIWEAVVG